MAAIIQGVTFTGLVTIGLDTGPPQTVGFLEVGRSTPAPPGAPLSVSAAFNQVSPPPGVFAFYDGFTTPDPSILDGRLVDGTNGTSFTSAVNYPTGYTWSDSSGGASDIITGGSVTVITGVFPEVGAGQEYNMPAGMFIEFKYDAPTTDTTILFGFNLGYSSLSIVAGGTDGGYTNKVRIDASGFNGYTNPDGTALPKDPLDTTGTYSASYTLDRYYSTVEGDWRNKVMRAEVTETTLRIYADGVLLIDQIPRFAIQLFASDAYVLGSSNTTWSTGYASLTTFSSGPPDPMTIDYISVGTL